MSAPREKNGWLILRPGEYVEGVAGFDARSGTPDELMEDPMPAPGDAEVTAGVEGTDIVSLLGREGWKEHHNCLIMQDRDRALATISLNGPRGEQIFNGSARNLAEVWRMMLITCEAKGMMNNGDEAPDAPVEALR